MDFFGDVNARNFSRERVEARSLRRMQRSAIFRATLQDAGTRNAQMAWALQPRNPDEDPGFQIGSQHPGQAAIIAVRQTLSEFNLPTEMRARFIGMHRYSGRGAHAIDDGVVNIEVAFRSLSGVDHAIEVPVNVHNGRVLAPVMFLDRGEFRAMTQTAFDDILDRSTFLADAPNRVNMFSPPPEDRRPPIRTPIVRPGMFGFSPINKQLTAAYVRSAISGHYVTDLPAFNAMREDPPDHIQPGERPPPSIGPGDKIRLKKGIDVVARDGQRYHLTSGTSGEVLRDIAGDGFEYYVRFPEIAYVARVRGELIE